MPRPLSPQIDAALEDAALRLLAERGFARMSVAAVAAAAGVGKPAVYRRFRGKAELVVAAIGARLPEMRAPDVGDTYEELRTIAVLPDDAEGYVGLIGGLMAEHRHHPELIETFRERVLHPRRALVQSVIERGQRRGDIRPELDPQAAMDHFGGAFLARVFAGLDTGPAWRDRHFNAWWELMRL